MNGEQQKRSRCQYSRHCYKIHFHCCHTNTNFISAEWQLFTICQFHKNEPTVRQQTQTKKRIPPTYTQRAWKTWTAASAFDCFLAQIFQFFFHIVFHFNVARAVLFFSSFYFILVFVWEMQFHINIIYILLLCVCKAEWLPLCSPGMFV